MHIPKSKIKLFLLYIYAFYLIYTPIFGGGMFYSKFFILTLLLLLIVLNYILKGEKGFLQLIRKKTVLFLMSGIFISSIYYLIIALLNNIELTGFGNLRLIQNNIFIIYIMHICILVYELKKLNYSKLKCIEFLLKIAAFQGVISIMMVLIPSFKEFANYLYLLNGLDNPYILASRVYGISADYTFATPIYHGALIGICLFYSMRNEKKFLIYLPFILITTMLNNRTGILIAIVGLVFAIIYFLFTSKNLKKVFLYILFSMFILFGSYQLLSIFAPGSSRYIDFFIDDTLLLFQGKLSGNYAILFDGSFFTPDGLDLLFGKGIHVYTGIGNQYGYSRSDVGYINDLFLGGLIYIGILYGSIIGSLFSKYRKKTSIEKWICWYVLLTLLISNLKGEIFHSTTFLFLPFFLTIINLDIKKKEPKVSIIVPIYNAEKYLDRTVNSVLDQTFSNFELLLVDDGSTDLSKKIIQNYEMIDSRVHGFYKCNSGVSDTRNVGIDNAKGDYLCFLDSDDFYHKKFLEKMILEIEDCDIAYCGYYCFSKSITKRKKTVFSSSNVLKKYFLDQIRIQTACFMVNKDFLNGRHFSSGISWAEDIEFFSTLLSSTTKIRFVSNYLIYYNVEEEEAKLSNFSLKKADLDFSMMNKMLGELPLTRQEKKAIVHYRLPALITYRLTEAMRRNLTKEVREYYEKYKAVITNAKIVNGLRSLKLKLTLQKLIAQMESGV